MQIIHIIYTCWHWYSSLYVSLWKGNQRTHGEHICPTWWPQDYLIWQRLFYRHLPCPHRL